MYIIDDQTPAGRALRQAAETLANGIELTAEWPRAAAELLDLQWQEIADNGNQAAAMTGRLLEEDAPDQRVEIVIITAKTQWLQGERTPLYTATPLIRLQPVGRHPKGRIHGIRARVADWLKAPSLRRLQKTQSHNPEQLMTHMTQTTLEAVMRMAHGMTRPMTTSDEQEIAQQMAKSAVAAVNRQSAQNRTILAGTSAGNVPVEVVKCRGHDGFGRKCQVMMDGSHQPTRATSSQTTQDSRPDAPPRRHLRQPEKRRPKCSSETSQSAASVTSGKPTRNSET